MNGYVKKLEFNEGVKMEIIAWDEEIKYLWKKYVK
jgi:hypothetical protein